MNWNKGEFYASYGVSSQLPEPSIPEIAFAGKSNVGKSSLINKLCNRKNLARTSSTQGKTTTINFYKFADTDAEFFIADLPGYGYAKVSQSEKERWAELIENYINSGRESLYLVVQLIDIRHEPSQGDIDMINFLIDTETPFIIALTKADKLRPLARKERMIAFESEIPYFDEIKCIPFSTVTGEGVEEMRKVLLDAVSETIDEEFTDI